MKHKIMYKVCLQIHARAKVSKEEFDILNKEGIKQLANEVERVAKKQRVYDLTQNNGKLY